MPRQTLDREIHHLQDEVLLLGSMVEQAMLNAIDTLKRRDLEGARQVYNNDEQINEKRYAIENRLMILFATQQPIAHDLRLLAAIMEVITELERMGDYLSMKMSVWLDVFHKKMTKLTNCLTRSTIRMSPL